MALIVHTIDKNWEERCLNQVIRADCMNVLPTLPDKSVNLVLTDPPYGIRKKEEWDDRENFLKQVDKWLKECLRVGRTVIWFCADIMLPYVLKGRENDFHRMLIWNKPPGTQFAGGINSNIYYSCEFICVFGEYPKSVKGKKIGYTAMTYGNVRSKRFNHPSVKPEGLIRDLLFHYSEEGDVVLDPFSGSGTVAAVCKEMKRDFIAIEKDPEYHEMSVRRLESVTGGF